METLQVYKTPFIGEQKRRNTKRYAVNKRNLQKEPFDVIFRKHLKNSKKEYANEARR